MSCGGSSDSGAQLRKQQEQQQASTNESIQAINKAFSGFTPQFFKGASDAYINWANPQLQNQYQQTKNQTGFKLANQGLQKSSQAQGLYNQLGQQQTLAQQNIAGAAQDEQNKLRSSVESEKAQLYGQAQFATNPGAFGQQAIAAANGFSAPSTFQPLGRLFDDYANTFLAKKAGDTYNPQTAMLANLFTGKL